VDDDVLAPALVQQTVPRERTYLERADQTVVDDVTGHPSLSRAYHPANVMKEAAKQLTRDRVEVRRSRLPPPVLTFTGGRTWRLESEYAYVDGARTIVVRAGFVFDLSSVPRLLWWLIAPFELSVVAPLIHDFMYRYGGDPPPGSVQPPHTYSRVEVDRVFRRIMEAEGVAAWRRLLGYVAVRVFGMWAWRRDRRAGTA
jgi:hypothetical protein